MSRDDLLMALLKAGGDMPVVATTPHGTYSFTLAEAHVVESLDRGREEFLLRLEPIES